MTKYIVTLEETCRFYIPIEAENETDAGEKALDRFSGSRDPWKDFDGENQNVQLIFVLPIA